mmetsp:Transcript_36517/g.41622  ORF Transcript_36517/g.41622 Transcript_36517/m.41622 type:complete len:164 (-) Transcript_36517:301-792(-)
MADKTLFLHSSQMEAEDVRKGLVTDLWNKKRKNIGFVLGGVGGLYLAATQKKLQGLAFYPKVGLLLTTGLLGRLILGSNKCSSAFADHLKEKYSDKMSPAAYKLDINPWLTGLEDGDAEQQRVCDNQRIDSHSKYDDNLLTVKYVNPAINSAAEKRRHDAAHH